MSTLPLIITLAGPQPTPPAALRAALVAKVAATNPGYTANLPLSMIEDISSTCTGALTLIDQMRVDTVNSVSPYGADAFVTNELGQVYGVPQGAGYNTNVYVVFSGSPGFPINLGFTVSDGTYQYVVQDGGVISGFGQSPALYCLANVPGSWAVPAGTVTTIATSVPASVTLSCTNPNAGLPGAGSQSQDDYNAQVLQACLATTQGVASFFRTQLSKVPGVQSRLVAPLRTAAGNWELIVGGGDPYAVAYAIYTSFFDFFNIVGSTLSVTNITAANPGVVTTDLNHGLITGQSITMTGIVGPTALNGVPQIVTVLTEKTFSIGDTSGLPAYVSGGVINPNPRNIAVTINDYPDVYPITFVNPPQQTVNLAVLWNTQSTNAVSNAAMQQAAAPALVAYVNSILVGRPMNLYELQSTFQISTASILPTDQLTTLKFTVTINGIGVAPVAGTGILLGDPESYFETDVTKISIVQG